MMKTTHRQSSFKTILSLLCGAALLLSGCDTIKEYNVFSPSDDKAPLPGERISVLELQRELEPTDAALKATGFIAQEPWKNDFWPQAGGYPNHAMQNLALSDKPLKEIWDADIGNGSQKRQPLTAQPIVFDNKIYTLDTTATLSAFDTKTGKNLWQNSLKPKNEDEAVITGGIAYSSGIIYATSGYNELLAINPASGGIYWRAALPSPSRAAPSIMDDRVYVSTLDNRLIAFNAADGKELWQYQAFNEVAGLIGAASPAINREIVVPVFSSGEVIALRTANGSVAWADNLSPVTKISSGIGALPDIQALPVIDKGLVFAISFSNKMVAINERTGQRVWQKELGGADTPWIAGNHIFLISSQGELVALGRDNGAISWVKPLASYSKEKDIDHNALFWNGPVLAGGRLIITGPEGLIAEINPHDGALIRSWNIDSPAAVAPIVADNTLYLLQENGTLVAYQ